MVELDVIAWVPLVQARKESLVHTSLENLSLPYLIPYFQPLQKGSAKTLPGKDIFLEDPNCFCEEMSSC